MALLDVKNLSLSIHTSQGLLHAVKDISFKVDEGKTLGIVGESGCGKSLTSLAVMDLLPPNAELKAQAIQFQGRDLLELGSSERRNLSGTNLSMIFQDPMVSLNPCFTVGYQLQEAILRCGKLKTTADVKKRSIELLKRVGIPSPETRLTSYPHELSGGMSQRVMIAMAISCNPKLLIADEPTTALDVTIQAQILSLLLEIQRETGMSMILISHDMGVISQMADEIAVMYAGEIVESAETSELLTSPRHPYTASLIRCLPAHQTKRKGRLESIAGAVPNLIHRPTGCSFHLRCSKAISSCSLNEPEWIWDLNTSHRFKCHSPMELLEAQ